MTKLTARLAIFLATIFWVAGCDNLPGLGSPVMVLDLAAAAQQLGRNEAMQKQAQVERERLNAELVGIASQLEKQLAAEQKKLGDAPTEAQQQAFGEVQTQLQQRYADAQLEAQQKAQQFEAGLVTTYRDEVVPIAERVARSRGGKLVLIGNQSIFWADSSVDITADVISELEAAQAAATTE